MRIIDQEKDRKYLVSLQDGNDRAFEYFYYKFKNQVYSFALKLLIDREMAREIVQQVFVKLWENRAKLDPDRSVEPYLYVVTRNACFDWLAKVNREKKLKMHFVEMNDMRNCDTENSVLLQEYEELAINAVASLPEKRRQVFELYRKEELTYEQIATELGISKNTVKTHLLKSYKSIKEYLKKSSSTFYFFFF
jgi:RNA polymerase sigma-70 factor (family 1)